MALQNGTQHQLNLFQTGYILNMICDLVSSQIGFGLGSLILRCNETAKKPEKLYNHFKLFKHWTILASFTSFASNQKNNLFYFHQIRKIKFIWDWSRMLLHFSKFVIC
jgi:hypothetical protein